MSDYIKREDAKRAIRRNFHDFGTRCMINNVINEVAKVSSDNLVEVVRCKDCKHYKRNIPCCDGYYNGCDEWIDEGNAITVYDSDYCSYGERAEE